ncbi:unnamed protein product [Angiostrongylus costaricensis]|uniref:Glyco_trans_2-like domain-containing protein n=1 Tax=Angiostrongylus costaricensis TaxID=334426 RepID=A0A0R3Q0Y5_ANGCS|nr:unnamed protein product [Angiostrongylus costaricensis]
MGRKFCLYSFFLKRYVEKYVIFSYSDIKLKSFASFYQRNTRHNQYFGKANRFHGRYVLLLEDDALVVPKFAEMMASLLKQLDQRQEIDYVKMYHPGHLRKIPSIPMALIISCAVCYIYQIIVIRRFLADLRYYVTDTVYMSMAESCCTPAVLFRAQKIPQISRRSAAEGNAKDHILDESPFIGRQTDTNLVVHIGSMSSIRHRRITLDEVLLVESRKNH